MPADAWAAAKADEVFAAAEELSAVNPIVNVFRDESFAEKKAEYFAMFPAKLARLASVLGAQQFFGGELSYADLNVFHYLDNSRLLEPACLDAHANVVAFMARIEQV
jgi:glutathione S-transferase